MDILYVIRSKPNSSAFTEAVTALLGTSLFGRDIGYLLIGDAITAIEDPDSPLAQVADMELAQGYIRLDAASSLSTSEWATGFKQLTPAENHQLLRTATHILSF
jgi:hypothetical protein